MTDILKRLETRFDPRIVQPDEMARDAHAEIVRLRRVLDRVRIWTTLQDDTVWYDSITTLHDLCQQALNG